MKHDGGVGAAEGEPRLEEGAGQHIERLLSATGDHRDHHQCEGDRSSDGTVAVHGAHHPHVDEDAADDRRHALEDVGKRADEGRHLFPPMEVEVDAAEESEGDRDERGKTHHDEGADDAIEDTPGDRLTALLGQHRLDGGGDDAGEEVEIELMPALGDQFDQDCQ